MKPTAEKVGRAITGSESKFEKASRGLRNSSRSLS
jgi:hypothetical protein